MHTREARRGDRPMYNFREKEIDPPIVFIIVKHLHLTLLHC